MTAPAAPDLLAPDPPLEPLVAQAPDAPAPLVGRWAKIAGLGEQVVISGVTFLVTLVAGRLLPRAEFAALGLAVALYYAVTGVHRNLVIIQFTLDSARRDMGGLRPKVWDRLAVAAALAQAAAALAAGLLLQSTGVVEPWIAQGVVGGAALLLTAPIHDYCRYRCTTSGRGTVVAASAATFGVVQPLLAAGLLFGLKSTSGAAVAATLALSYGAALAPMWWATRRLGVETGERVTDLLRREWPKARLNLVGHGAYVAYTQLIVFLVAGRLGAVAAAAFVATRSLMNPVATVVTGLDNTQKVDVAYAEAWGGAAAVLPLVVRQIGIIVLVCAPYIVGVGVFGGPLLKLAFGPKYAGDGALLAWWSVAFVALMASQPLESGLLALRMGGRLLAGRLLAAALGVATAWAGADLLGVSGAVIGMGAGVAASAVVAGDGLWRAARRGRMAACAA